MKGLKGIVSKNFKKFLCLTMVVALVLGTINLNGLNTRAASDEPKPSEGTVSIASGYATVNEHGEVDVSKTTKTAKVTSEDGNIEISKTIASKNEGYDITLNVKTSQTVTSNDIAQSEDKRDFGNSPKSRFLLSLRK